MEGHIGPVQKVPFPLWQLGASKEFWAESAQKHVCRQVRRVTLGRVDLGLRWERELRESRMEVIAVVEARHKSVSKRGNRQSKEEGLEIEDEMPDLINNQILISSLLFLIPFAILPD